MFLLLESDFVLFLRLILHTHSGNSRTLKFANLTKQASRHLWVFCQYTVLTSRLMLFYLHLFAIKLKCIQLCI